MQKTRLVSSFLGLFWSNAGKRLDELISSLLFALSSLIVDENGDGIRDVNSSLVCVVKMVFFYPGPL